MVSYFFLTVLETTCRCLAWSERTELFTQFDVNVYTMGTLWVADLFPDASCHFVDPDFIIVLFPPYLLLTLLVSFFCHATLVILIDQRAVSHGKTLLKF